MRKIRSIDPVGHANLYYSRDDLRKALRAAQRGGAVRTVAKIRSALKSIDGALRHAKHAVRRAQERLTD